MSLTDLHSPARKEAWRRAKDADEAFWKDQERAIQGGLGQPCCTLSGISTSLMNLPGNFAVVVHGEDECAACFLHHGVSAHRFFCTGLDERHLVTGVTAPRLRRCLRLVAEEVAPEAIFVLGACPIEVIGDQFDIVVDEIAAEYPHIQMRALHTSGLKAGTQNAMLDWLYSTLVSLPGKPAVDPAWRERAGAAGLDLVDAWMSLSPQQLVDRYREAVSAAQPVAVERARSVAILGLPSPHDLGGYQGEWREVLGQSGVTLLAELPYQAGLDDWRSAASAGAMLVVDRAMYPRTVEVLEAGGQQVRNVELPIGVAATDAFYATVQEVTGVDLTAALAPRRAAAVAAAEGFAAHYGGMRMALGLRMLNNYKTDQLAAVGLGDHSALCELGFDITLLVQGEPERKAEFTRMYERRGFSLPFQMFVEPWNLSVLLAEGGFEVAYLGDYCREEARKANVPMITSRLLYPGYDGVARNAAVIAGRIEQLGGRRQA